jgi:Lrp/AsnC family transcriptional regulator
MDKINRKIIDIIQKDCTISVKDISQMVGLSYTPTYERIKYLEESGVIQGKVSILNPKKIGINFFAYCNIALKEPSKESLDNFEEKVKAMPEVMEVVSLSGNYDYMLKIATTDIEAYNDFITSKIANIKNIGQYHSNIVMSVVKNETAYHIPEKV